MALLLAALMFPARVGASEPPARVVSLNLCLDQLVLAVAAPGQVIAVSDVAQDPHLSAQWRAARALPAVHARVEE
ncbi:MAG TPA: ABC transporter substrate-binding protein, partial [Vineibacter sp.]|nr:ABC transporter substrate-binding protein [Vineibacter sp.]